MFPFMKPEDEPREITLKDMVEDIKGSNASLGERKQNTEAKMKFHNLLLKGMEKGQTVEDAYSPDEVEKLAKRAGLKD